MVQFLGYENQPAHRKALFPVIAQLLCFTPEDHKAVAAQQADSASIWSALSSFTGAGATGLSLSAMGARAPAKPLPPSVPMGLDITDAGHSSPFAPSSCQKTTTDNAAHARERRRDGVWLAGFVLTRTLSCCARCSSLCVAAPAAFPAASSAFPSASSTSSAATATQQGASPTRRPSDIPVDSNGAIELHSGH